MCAKVCFCVPANWLKRGVATEVCVCVRANWLKGSLVALAVGSSVVVMRLGRPVLSDWNVVFAL